VLYSQLLEQNTLSAYAHLWLGVSLHLCGDTEAAARALRGALFLDPLLWPASYYLALCLERLERPSEARREYRRVLDTAHAELSKQEVSPILGDLDTWKRDILTIARERSGTPRRTA
jgi:Flp pilus assembly protein TadD